MLCSKLVFGLLWSGMVRNTLKPAGIELYMGTFWHRDVCFRGDTAVPAFETDFR